ncbi:MAG TPA: universal stress protein [Polyangiaceae bacterium]|nr:universal stress protein [Polyangiaceae bacterium]
MMFHNILVPIDYSDNSLVALEMAGRLAQQFNSRLDLVHVWDRPTYMSDAVLVGHGPGQKALGELIHENAHRDMQEFLATVKLPPGVTANERLVSGDPATMLLKEIKTHAYDLVVMGTHGRSGLAHLLLGSIAEKLIRHAAVPILTVPGRK